MADGKRGRRPDSPEMKAAKKRLKEADSDQARMDAEHAIEVLKHHEKTGKSGAAPGRTTEHAIWRPEDLDDEQLRVVFLQNVSALNRADAQLEKAKEDRKSILNKAQAEYGQNFLEHMKLDERLQRDDGKKLFCETMEGAARIARWNQVPIQTDLFAEDRMPVEDRTFEDGKRVGMAGGDPAAPSHLNGPLAGKWTEGWHAGQEVARSRLLSMNAPPAGRDLDEGTEVFDYFAEGAEARRKGDGGVIPDGYSKVQGDEWLRGWAAAADQIDAGRGAQAA